MDILDATQLRLRRAGFMYQTRPDPCGGTAMLITAPDKGVHTYLFWHNGTEETVHYAEAGRDSVKAGAQLVGEDIPALIVQDIAQACVLRTVAKEAPAGLESVRCLTSPNSSNQMRIQVSSPGHDGCQLAAFTMDAQGIRAGLKELTENMAKLDLTESPSL